MKKAENIKTTKTTKATKSSSVKIKAPRKPRTIKQEVKIEESRFSVKLFLWWTFKIITFPFYIIYLWLFKIPTEGPMWFLGLVRFAFFITVGLYTNNLL